MSRLTGFPKIDAHRLSLVMALAPFVVLPLLLGPSAPLSGQQTVDPAYWYRPTNPGGPIAQALAEDGKIIRWHHEVSKTYPIKVWAAQSQEKASAVVALIERYKIYDRLRSYSRPACWTLRFRTTIRALKMLTGRPTTVGAIGLTSI